MLTTGMDAGPSLQRGAQAKLFRDEWVRCFGDSKFDHIVDFSGYNPFWDYVLLQGEAKSRSVWLHNDVLADSQREIAGRRPHERNLRSVFTTYHRFDNLVSVSASCTPSPCSGSGDATPLVVNLALAVHDPQSGATAANYPINLTGQRRQS